MPISVSKSSASDSRIAAGDNAQIFRGAGGAYAATGAVALGKGSYLAAAGEFDAHGSKNLRVGGYDIGAGANVTFNTESTDGGAVASLGDALQSQGDLIEKLLTAKPPAPGTSTTGTPPSATDSPTATTTPETDADAKKKKTQVIVVSFLAALACWFFFFRKK